MSIGALQLAIWLSTTASQCVGLSSLIRDDSSKYRKILNRHTFFRMLHDIVYCILTTCVRLLPEVT